MLNTQTISSIGSLLTEVSDTLGQNGTAEIARIVTKEISNYKSRPLYGSTEWPEYMRNIDVWQIYYNVCLGHTGFC